MTFVIIIEKISQVFEIFFKLVVSLFEIFLETLKLNSVSIFMDAPRAWGLYFQDPATPAMAGIIRLHDLIMFYLIIIIVGVTYFLSYSIYSYSESKVKFSLKFFRHGTLIEIIWTVLPAFILVAIAFPSFKLLYLIDEVIDPKITLKAIGHQWYWSYEISDYVQQTGKEINFDSYMIPTDDLKQGELRLLEVDNRVILPINTHIRMIITGADVIHSWAVPSLGIKVDAIPGRINQASMVINREGVFYGQCSEICGVQHGFMPIVVESVPLEKYIAWACEQLGIAD